jgi:repressor LexA
MDIGTIITKYCDEHGMSSTEFANRVGVSRAYIYMLKRGKRYKAEKDVIPSVDTIEKLAKAMMMSSGELMALITEKDKTEHKEGKSASIPLVGRVAAGMPIHAEDNIIGYVDIPKRVAEQNDMFALLIKGNSMYPEIKDGDIVVVRKQGFVENRDIAIVRINGEDATCKRIEITDEGITLIPINPEYESKHFTKEEVETLPVEIVGKVFEVRRRF